MLALVAASCASPNFELTTATTPVCTADADNEWNRVVNQTQGVRGHDPAGHFIADFPAEKFGIFNINNWQPLSGFKETMCGQLHHFNVFDGSGAEMDWNNFVIPSPAFQFVITDALPFKGGSGTFCVDDDWQSCVGQDDCLEAEITPDETFYENPWFPKSTGASVLEGREVCMYGPWIRECVHGHRPEIHTAELTWWKEKFGSGSLHWLMALQDDSNRFDDSNEFDIEGSTPPGWRPWGSAPMTSRFDLAFEVNPGGPVLEFQIGEGFARNVVTSLDAEASRDADDSTGHAIEFNGTVVLRANEIQPNDNDLGVTFTDVCRRSDGKLRGFVTLVTKFGVDNEGKEGYHILFAHAKEVGQVTPPVTTPETKADVIVLTRGDPDSMRSTQQDGRTQLVGDLQLEVVTRPGTSSQAPKIERAELVTKDARRPLTYEPGQKPGGLVVRGLPLHDASRLAIRLSSGALMEVEWPGLGITALMNDEVRSSTDAPASAWPAFLGAAGGLQAAPAQGLTLKHVSRVQLRAVPQYALSRGGKPSIEEGSPFVEKLNEVLSGQDGGARQKVFGSAQPVKIQWSFTATNLATKKPMTITKGQPAAGRSDMVGIVETAGQMANDVVEVSFPDARDAIYELEASAAVTDVFGTTRKITRRVWSHFLSDTTRDGIVTSLLPVVAAAAGVSAEELLRASKLGVLPPNDSRLRDPRIRRALIVHNVARQAADDRQISVAELASLIRGAKAVATP